MSLSYHAKQNKTKNKSLFVLAKQQNLREGTGNLNASLAASSSILNVCVLWPQNVMFKILYYIYVYFICLKKVICLVL